MPETGTVSAAPLSPRQHIAMIMPVQHQLGAVLLDDGLEAGRIVERALARRLPGERRVMNEDHADQPRCSEPVEHAGQPLELLTAYAAGGNERCARQRRIHPNQRHRPDVADERKPPRL